MHVGDACNAQSLTGVQDCVAPIVGTFRWPGYDDSIAFTREKMERLPGPRGFLPRTPSAGRARREVLYIPKFPHEKNRWLCVALGEVLLNT